MSDGEPNVLFIPADLGGCGYYRCISPAMAGNWKWSGLGLGNLEEGKNDIHQFDIVVQERLLTSKQLGAITAIQSEGIKSVYEIDDYFHGIANLNYHHSRKAYANQRRCKLGDTAMRNSDAVIVSTEDLARRYKRNNKNIHVVENCLDMNRYQYKLPKRDTINIGWAGGSDHYMDLLQISGVLERVKEKYCSKVAFYFIGTVPDFFSKDLDIQLCGFTPIENYPSAMTNFDIGLAPLVENAFNNSKSDLKILEYGALKIPSIVSPVGPYKGLEEKGSPVLEATTPDEWFDRISELVDDEAKRKELGEASYQYVVKNRTMLHMVKRYKEVFNEILGGEAFGSDNGTAGDN